mmetsp:Transcript_23677/g.65669  ORF Transcript_23677/g.65669 Transcript_23677/m.65669 type:complete len:232 (-) Transcript_23677:1689-2384(-)
MGVGTDAGALDGAAGCALGADGAGTVGLVCAGAGTAGVAVAPLSGVAALRTIGAIGCGLKVMGALAFVPLCLEDSAGLGAGDGEGMGAGLALGAETDSLPWVAVSSVVFSFFSTDSSFFSSCCAAPQTMGALARLRFAASCCCFASAASPSAFFGRAPRASARLRAAAPKTRCLGRPETSGELLAGSRLGGGGGLTGVVFVGENSTINSPSSTSVSEWPFWGLLLMVRGVD